MIQKLIIIGLIVGLGIVSISYMDLMEEYETLELHYGYAMEMSKRTVEKQPDIIKEIRGQINSQILI